MSGPEEDVRIEVCGLAARGPHGVSEAEREVGCRILAEVALTLRSGAVESDRLDDTVDYAAVAGVVGEIIRERSCRTLERLAALIADALEERFAARDVEVRVAKPEPPMAEPVGEVAVALRRGSA